MNNYGARSSRATSRAVSVDEQISREMNLDERLYSDFHKYAFIRELKI